MSKRDKESNGGDQSADSPVVTLEPEAAVDETAPDAATAATVVDQGENTQAETQDPWVLREQVTKLLAQTEELKASLAEKDMQIADKDKEMAELKDNYLRALAESENVRRRTRQQSEESIRFQRETLLRELLPIVDNLERAVDAARGGGNGKSIFDGVELVLASVVEFLKRQGVTAQTSVGQPFDPSRHEAIEHVPSEAHPPNTVVQEFHREYRIGDRVLRPARVVVAKGAGQQTVGFDRKNGENGDDDVEKS